MVYLIIQPYQRLDLTNSEEKKREHQNSLPSNVHEPSNQYQMMNGEGRVK
jgi:hypothetical protein